MDEFRKIARAYGVDQTTTQILIQEDFCDIKTLEHIDLDKDLAAMGISSGQSAVVERWVQDLRMGTPLAEQQWDDERMRCRLDLDEQLRMNAEVKDHVLSRGVRGLDVLFQRILSRNREKRYNLAIVGESGAGKSSLINALCGYESRHTRAASVSVSKSTLELQPYPHPTVNNLVLWDMPLVGSSIADADLWRFDAIIILSTRRFTETDSNLAKEAHGIQLPFFYVRNKTDQDVENAKRDMGNKFNEAQVLTRIREDALQNLASFESGLVFLVSSIKGFKQRWDLPNLETESARLSKQKSDTPLKNKLCQTAKDALEIIVQREGNTLYKHAKQVAEVANEHIQTDLMNNKIQSMIMAFGISGSEVDENQMQLESQQEVRSMGTLRVNPADFIQQPISYTRFRYLGVVCSVMGVFWLYRLSGNDEWNRWVCAAVPLVLSVALGYLADKYMEHRMLMHEMNEVMYKEINKAKQDQAHGYLRKCLGKIYENTVWFVERKLLNAILKQK